jgi:hypothetical protein
VYQLRQELTGRSPQRKGNRSIGVGRIRVDLHGDCAHAIREVDEGGRGLYDGRGTDG